MSEGIEILVKVFLLCSVVDALNVEMNSKILQGRACVSHTVAEAEINMVLRFSWRVSACTALSTPVCHHIMCSIALRNRGGNLVQPESQCHENGCARCNIPLVRFKEGLAASSAGFRKS